MAGDEGVLAGNGNNLGWLSVLHHNAEHLGVMGLIVSNQDAHNFSVKPHGE